MQHISTFVIVAGLLLLGACSREYPTELMNAAKDGNLQAVMAAAKRGVEVNGRSNKGKNALMFAASEGHLDVVQWLLGQGTNVNDADNYGTTALIVASTAGHHEVVKLLLAHDADPQVRDDSGSAPLVNAVYFGHTETVQLLIDHLMQGNNSSSSESSSQEGMLQNRDPQTLASLEKKRRLDKRDGEELMMLAAGLGHIDVVRLMAKAGIDVNGRGLKQRTPLMSAAAFNRVDVINVLLEAGADPLARDEDGNTAIDVAQDRGSADVEAVLTKIH